jgi:putative FmdB family regulatory protein
MPSYEYKCKECGARFELLTDSPSEVKCISCESDNLTKQESPISDTSCGGNCGGCGGCH